MSSQYTFEEMLSGGHHNSLGNTEEVVSIIMKDHSLIEDLYETYSSEDELVRLRVSSAFKRLFRAKPDWFPPFIDRFLSEVSKIDQASAQWTTAQLFNENETLLSVKQKKTATKLLQHNLTTSDDWIVQNVTMETLKNWAKDDRRLSEWLKPQLLKLQKSHRKSVARRAEKYFYELYK